MITAAITNAGQIGNLYFYGETHYNQVESTPVPAVNRIQATAPLSEKENTLHYAALYQHDSESLVQTEESAAQKGQEALSDAYAGQDMAQYNAANPYELARMAIENSLLAGMHINMLA